MIYSIKSIVRVIGKTIIYFAHIYNFNYNINLLAFVIRNNNHSEAHKSSYCSFTIKISLLRMALI